VQHIIPRTLLLMSVFVTRIPAQGFITDIITKAVDTVGDYAGNQAGLDVDSEQFQLVKAYVVTGIDPTSSADDMYRTAKALADSTVVQTITVSESYVSKPFASNQTSDPFKRWADGTTVWYAFHTEQDWEELTQRLPADQLGFASRSYKKMYLTHAQMGTGFYDGEYFVLDKYISEKDYEKLYSIISDVYNIERRFIFTTDKDFRWPIEIRFRDRGNFWYQGLVPATVRIHSSLIGFRLNDTMWNLPANSVGRWDDSFRIHVSLPYPELKPLKDATTLPGYRPVESQPLYLPVWTRSPGHYVMDTGTRSAFTWAMIGAGVGALAGMIPDEAGETNMLAGLAGSAGGTLVGMFFGAAVGPKKYVEGPLDIKNTANEAKNTEMKTAWEARNAPVIQANALLLKIANEAIAKANEKIREQNRLRGYITITNESTGQTFTIKN